MRKLHIHIAVEDLSKSVSFYSTLFRKEPDINKSDYVKWQLDEPSVNFALTARGFATGIDHFGIQVDTEEELRQAYDRFERSGGDRFDIGETTCCYATLRKSWVRDPQGVLWEAFMTERQNETYGEDPETFLRWREPSHSSCCAKSETSFDVMTSRVPGRSGRA